MGQFKAGARPCGFVVSEKLKGTHCVVKSLHVGPVVCPFRGTGKPSLLTKLFWGKTWSCGAPVTMGLRKIQWKWPICCISKSLWKVWRLKGGVSDRTKSYSELFLKLHRWKGAY